VRHADAIIGSLVATAVGDALGLPYEGLSRRRIARLKPAARYRLVLGRGMVSDDTDHAAAVAHALAVSAGDPGQFERQLALNIRAWFLALPAGVGMATAKSCIRMCLGYRSPGVRSAGNGPAMRAPVLGAAIADRERLVELVRRSSLLTHSDPRALQGALAVALAARRFREPAAPRPSELVEELRGRIPDLDASLVEQLDGLVACESISTSEFALARGHASRVSGYIVHSVPVALHAAFSNPQDPVAAALACIACGGDTDTTAAIAAGVVGARVGLAGIPQELVAAIWDWPRGTPRLREWGEAAARAMELGAPERPSLPRYPLCLARNLIFLGVVLAHAARRALPPY
jgi:ADP-ribosylglycohydrolase